MSAAFQHPLPPLSLTVPEFLEWAASPAGGEGAAWQLRDGAPELMAPAAEPHGAIQAELARLLGNHLADTGRRCRVVVEPGVIPRLRSERNMLVPDLGVTCAPPSSGVALPEPLVLVEIVSPSNERATRANLWAFATIPSVAEIVSVWSVAVKAEILRRLPDGAWPERPEAVGEDGAVRLHSLGFEAPLRALYRTTALSGAEG